MDPLTPYFPQLRAQCAPLGRQVKRASAATESLVGLAALFGGHFAGLLVPAKQGPGSRQREFPRVAVFWAFLGQVLLRGASCRWALTRLQADAVARGPPAAGRQHRRLLYGPRRPAAAVAAGNCCAGCGQPRCWSPIAPIAAGFFSVNCWTRRSISSSG